MVSALYMCPFVFGTSISHPSTVYDRVQAAMVALSVDPAGNTGFGSSVGSAERAASVGAISVHQLYSVASLLFLSR